MTHLESVSFVGSYLAVAETERQGLCPTCVERRATNAHELAIANMGYRAAVTACTDQGLVYKHLSLRQMKEALLLYQRRRQLPFVAMNKAQLAKICRYARSALAVAEGGEPISPDDMDHWEMIEFLTSFCGSPCAPNGILNDASDWEEEPADQEEEELASLDRTPLADTTNGAAWSSSTSAAAAAPRYKWSLDQATTKYEALRAALRAGVDIRGQLDGKPINTATPAHLARDIAAVLRKPSFRPVPVPPLPMQPLATPSQPSGTIEGITPLSLRCHSLDPQRQCFIGIGRLGLLYTRNQFASRSHELEHIIDHTEEVNPGFRFCWLCSSRFCTKEDAKHVEQCGEAYFATRPRPLTLAGLERHYRLPNVSAILDVVYYIPLASTGPSIADATTGSGRSTTSSPTSRWPTPAADLGGRKRCKWRLAHSETNECIVPYCFQSRQSLAVTFARPAEYCRRPIVRRSGKLGPQPTAHSPQHRTSDVRTLMHCVHSHRLAMCSIGFTNATDGPCSRCR